MEHVGLAAMTECPAVFVDVQRAGPSTGLPTLPAQQDVMQVRWGSHGDYEVIALSPSSPQECFDYAVTAFNLAERFRCPVFFMMDETVGHMLGKVKIPAADRIEVVERRFTARAPGDYKPFAIYEGDQPEMVRVGMGHRIHVTGLTHDERGYPAMNAVAQDKLIRRLCSKVLDHVDEISIHKSAYVEGSDVTVIAYGITARVARYAVELARQQGVKAGLVQLVTLWPFNERLLRDVAASTKSIIVAEMNLGQIVHEVRRVACGKVPVHFVGGAGGAIVEPEAIVARMREVAR
jgi:2-oxoglutarate ferredoxin oxidoreductase subunit alpha